MNKTMKKLLLLAISLFVGKNLIGISLQEVQDTVDSMIKPMQIIDEQNEKYDQSLSLSITDDKIIKEAVGMLNVMLRKLLDGLTTLPTDLHGTKETLSLINRTFISFFYGLEEGELEETFKDDLKKMLQVSLQDYIAAFNGNLKKILEELSNLPPDPADREEAVTSINTLFMSFFTGLEQLPKGSFKNDLQAMIQVSLKDYITAFVDNIDSITNLIFIENNFIDAVNNNDLVKQEENKEKMRQMINEFFQDITVLLGNINHPYLNMRDKKNMVKETKRALQNYLIALQSLTDQQFINTVQNVTFAPITNLQIRIEQEQPELEKIIYKIMNEYNGPDANLPDKLLTYLDNLYVNLVALRNSLPA